MRKPVFLLGCLAFGCTPPSAQQKNPAPSTYEKSSPQRAGATPNKPTLPQLCGNGTVDKEESCDDGNRSGGDGCSLGCRLEAVGFMHSRAIDQNGTMHPLPDAAPLSKTAQFSVSRFEHGTALLGGSPSALMMGLPPSYPVPASFEGQIEHFAGMGTLFTVALTNGEVWRMTAHGDQSEPCREFGLMDPPLMAQDGKRWCKWPRKSKRVIDLHIDCLVEEGGDLMCREYSNKTGWRLLKVDLPPVKSFSERATSCAILETGEVACWGYGRYGQTGYIVPGSGEEDEPSQPDPPKTFLKFKTPVKKIAADSLTLALTEGGELWCWGDCGELPFADTGEPEPYWHRMRLESPPKLDTPRKPVGASTMPSAPLKLPKGCVPRDFSWSCVLCEDGCTKCWHDKESLEKAECITY